MFKFYSVINERVGRFLFNVYLRFQIEIMCVNIYVNEFIIKRNYVIQKVKGCCFENWCWLKNGVLVNFQVLGIELVDMRQKVNLGCGVSELVNFGEEEGKESGIFREDVDVYFIIREKECKIRVILFSLVVISYVGLFKCKLDK